MDEPAISDRRIPELDGIRGAAVLMVLLMHFGSVRHLPPWYESLVGWGWIGVDLFFVLSGFLITSILIRTKSSSRYFARFYKNRVLRIFPLYYLYLLVVAIFVAAPLWKYLFYWVYLGNFLEATALSIPVLSHLWSLCIEEQFYLVWPLLLYKLSPKNLVRLCIFGIVTVAVFRIAISHFSLPSPEFVYKATPFRCDGLLFGALIAALHSAGALHRYRRWLPCLFLSGAGLFAFAIYVSGGVSYTPPVMERFGYVGVDLSFAAVVASAVAWQGKSGWAFARSRPLRFFGRYSYGLYVLHFPIWLILGRLPISNAIGLSLTRLATGVPLSVCAALISWRLWEARFIKRKEHLAPAREECKIAG